MGDTGSGIPGEGQQMMHGSMMQQTPNFYEQPQNYGKQERGGSDIGHGNNYDNTNAMMNRFSPKVSLGQDMNNVFSSSQGHGHVSQNQQFQAFNNKLKQKKQHHQMMSQNPQNSQQMLN